MDKPLFIPLFGAEYLMFMLYFVCSERHSALFLTLSPSLDLGVIRDTIDAYLDASSILSTHPIQGEESVSQQNRQGEGKKEEDRREVKGEGGQAVWVERARDIRRRLPNNGQPQVPRHTYIVDIYVICIMYP
jgi:hypothetical protein